MADTAYLLDAFDDPWSLLTPELTRKAISLRDYMLDTGRFNSDANVTLTDMVGRFVDAGLALERCATIVRILHSTNAASMRVWEREKGAVYVGIPYQQGPSDQYNASPSALAHTTRSWVRFNPQEIPIDTFGIVPELVEAGVTDYICAPTFMVNGMQNVFTFATKSESGFTDENIAFIQAAFPAIEACQEILVTHRILREVTRIYVGEEPHMRILGGDVHRGEVTKFKSAILFADMRDFTSITSEMSAEDATALLNEYYDCIVPSVESNQGEVLKFIGDGILAMFRAGEDGSDACANAIAAAREGLQSVDDRNKSGTPKFDVGMGLHFGEVAYGNVGSGERLDYTVIGRDVNLASRIAGLCSALDQRLLISSRLNDMLPDQDVNDCGDHSLKGLNQPTRVFAPV